MENTRDLYLISFGISVTAVNEARLNSISIERFQKPLCSMPGIQNTAKPLPFISMTAPGVGERGCVRVQLGG